MRTDRSSGDRAQYIQRMFSRIAPRYDMMNRLMTAGQDVAWRREVIRRADLNPQALLLDLGAGTGDLAREALRQKPGCQAVAADFTLGMMVAGQQRGRIAPDWCAADALNLPYPDGCFDALVSGFLLRNVSDLGQALREQFRVLKPGGRWVTLDTTPLPPNSPLEPLIRFHMRRVIPLLGTIITGQRDAYVYLPTSSENFLSAEALAAEIDRAGFSAVNYQRKMFGVVAIHWARKPARPVTAVNQA
ncbi:MAG: ubiquinone/menaquinone biosynthesis methyltransferase [Chloroflexota bacterium]